MADIRLDDLLQDEDFNKGISAILQSMIAAAAVARNELLDAMGFVYRLLAAEKDNGHG